MRYEFSFDEILSEHAYDRPLIVDGVRCHGGFVAGRYTSPRTRVRPDAIAAWQSRLPAGELEAVLDPITARVPRHFPNGAQTRLLVREGVTVPLVRILSLIAIVEGFGGEMLRSVAVPPLQKRVVEPIDGTALAHLAALFEAHARDEAGHRHMWELARDIALDRPEIPKDLAGAAPPSSGPRLLTEIPADLEALVGHIQEDETPHVGYLATALAELRCRTVVGTDGGRVPGRSVIDRARDAIVAFQSGPRHRANVEFRTQVVERYCAPHPRREALLAEFRALGTAGEVGTVSTAR